MPIRPATPDDLPSILSLISALADFEHLPGPDASAAARLREHAFGPRPYCEILVAEVDSAVVAYAIFFMTYSTFLARPTLYLEDLFVAPDHRGGGIGEAMLRRLAAVAIERECGRFEWQVLDWNVRAQEFYTALGARLLPEWRVCRVDGEALAALGA